MSSQLRKDTYTEYNGRRVPAWYAAEKVAKRVHGLEDWQGVASNGWVAPSGLKRLANAWLRSNGYAQSVVTELADDDGETSTYFPGWK